MTWTQKKNIDVIVPLVLAGIAGLVYFGKAKNKSWSMLLVLMAIVLGVAYVVTTKVTKGIYTAAPHDQQLPSDVGINSCNGYDPKALIGKLHDNMYGWLNVRDNAAFKELASLSNCELVKCWNFWKNEYYSEKGETLPVAIADEIAFMAPEFASIKATLAARFTSLNLS